MKCLLNRNADTHTIIGLFHFEDIQQLRRRIERIVRHDCDMEGYTDDGLGLYSLKASYSIGGCKTSFKGDLDYLNISKLLFDEWVVILEAVSEPGRRIRYQLSVHEIIEED